MCLRRFVPRPYRGLFDRRRGKPFPKRVPPGVAERVLELYFAREYFIRG
jgi:hypothetical protein